MEKSKIDRINELAKKENLTEELDYVEVGEVIRQAFIAANNKIYTYSKNHNKVMGMGTTATLSLVYANKIITAHVGDSRSYAIGKKIEQITRDHSYVQELVMRGEITKEQAKHHPNRNYITRAMGAEETVKVDVIIRPYNGEKILLCSDGLTNMLDDKDILEVVKDLPDPQHSVEKLIEMANEAGGTDNITVAIMERKQVI